MDLLKYLGKRIVTIFFSIIVIITITYILMYVAPGNFFDIHRFQQSAIGISSLDQENVEMLRKQFEKRYGMDQPLWKQILDYMGNAVTFKFGPSFYNPSNKIEDLVAAKFPVTLTLGLLGIALAIVIGVPLGIIAALRRNKPADYFATFIAMLGQGIPSYVVGTIFVALFAVTLQWLPATGWGDNWKQMILPVIAVALAPMATIARFTRVSLLDTLNQDYIRTAYAKGGTEGNVISKHAMRNSLVPIVTVIGPNLGFILAGSTVFVENIFRVPGLGQLFLQAASWRDYPLIVTSTFVLALTVMVMNLIVDLVYALLDPRIKLK